MAAKDIVKNLNLFVDGRGYAGQIMEVNPPSLRCKRRISEREAWMHASIKITMGMEAMDADFTVSSFSKDILSLWDVTEGAVVPFVLRGALESYDKTITPVAMTMRGKITEMDYGTWKPGEMPNLKVSMNLAYYKLQHGESVIAEITKETIAKRASL